MVAAPYISDLTSTTPEVDLTFQLPDPEDEQISDYEFQQQIEAAWQVCDRFDLQTDIWRGRILKTVRDREKRVGNAGGAGFLRWLADREISKSHAYNLMELADSADLLLQEGLLEPQDVSQFSKRAFIETAQAAPEVQQMVSEAAHRGDRITRREVRQLADEWTAVTSDLLPIEVKEKAADHTLPTRYLAPLVREMEKLPEAHQVHLRDEVAENPDIDTVKQVTAEARFLAKYLNAATQVQALNRDGLDLESALEEAMRIGCLNSTADLVNQAAQLEQAIAKLYTTWRRIVSLSERVYLDSGSSTPNLRSLLAYLTPLSGEILELQLGDPASGTSRRIRLKVMAEEEGDPAGDWE
ncbi:hypothetical protein [Thermoleptolyngbya sp. M55_K2018_002]|uniref:hypothetical protein n=1 Tax=Thermoleptolyngbya sp. M55_K2018_002 TaxID=2747808 RepID=UPI0019FE0EA9|nr:hypothetical protein [Thermoleptolyngbya sp. M55_K2018_002]HIK43122.1 hypothetical protein [Thermoleptolyngbya sp. M55_K2018_002]